MDNSLKKDNLFEPNKIRVYSGKYIDVFNPKVEDIDIIDIAHGLANQCRFGGHTQMFYSVAQHSIETMHYVAKSIEYAAEYCRISEEEKIYYKLAALLHDAAEAYILDIPSPNKRRMGGRYAETEEKLLETIFEYATGSKVTVSYMLTNEVVAGDIYQLQYEWKNIVIANLITPIPRAMARELFIMHYNNLKNQLNELCAK